MKTLFLLILIMTASSRQMLSQIDTLWKFDYNKIITGELMFSSNCEYIIANEANKVFYFDVAEQNYKYFALDSNIYSYTLQDKYFIYFDKLNSLAKFYYPEENRFFQIDIAFIQDYNFDKLAYYDDEVLLLVNDIYSRARIFNINSKEIILELTEANNMNCNALYKVPNKSYVIGNLQNEIFIYDYIKKQLLNRIKLPTEQAIEIPLYVVNDSILYYYDKYTLTMLNFKSSESSKKELDSTKVCTITKIFGNNSCLLINENNYKFYIFDYHNNSSLEINETRSQFVNLAIIDKDTLYFYKKTNSTSNSQCAIAYSINFDLNKTDTIYSECIVDTVFNSNFYSLNFMIFNEKGLMFDKAKIYNISNSNLLDSLPKMPFSYSPVIYDQENILLKKSKYSDDDTFLFFYDIKEFKIDSIGRTPFTEYNRKFALRDSASNFKQIFNTLSGEVLFTAKNINQSETDGAFNVSSQNRLDTVLFEISSNFLIVSDEGITDEFTFKDTVSIKQRYSPKFQVSKDKNLLFYKTHSAVKYYNISLNKMDSIPIEGTSYYIYLSDDSKYLNLRDARKHLIFDIENKELITKIEVDFNLLEFCGASFDYVIIKEKFDNGNLKSISCLKSNYRTSSIEEIFDFVQQDKMSIYPNPASQNININSDDYINKIEIYSVSGGLLKVYDNISTTKARLELETLQTGAYLIKAYFDGFTYSKKFVKE